ncbi:MULTISPECIES: histidine kinase sensor domain-containing protein [unclassified Pseudoalteromonas]|uniref:histidine kinase sensor domain-containing protein n=1 Tax=unclassified Pseudoalteromonas TaxID=194690 RepID=UPI0013FD1009|nr:MULTISPECIES: histidine kinase sensor domain-containing protein [unclassified Pseudoalteromonas]MBH0050090.1 histidine kinase sensor domain-containing protein [Pseudoalteromonas sp. SWYJZ19]MBH0077599.1 histidine kinase sensor domain-containing protein [Pseudoalteromonas sp. SWYJ118]
MTRRLFWKLCLIIGTGVVAMFYLINVAVNHFENDMSMLSDSSREELINWQKKAEVIFDQGDMSELERWVDDLQQQESIWAVIAKANVIELAGNRSHRYEYTGYNLGRSIDWKIHLYFEHAPVMQLPFKDGATSLVVQLPQRMHPGSLWNLTRLSLQVLLPMLILVCLSIVLYRHIMHPIKELDLASRAFSKGDFSVRVREQLGSRNDELSQLAETFDLMAERISDQIMHQRVLLTDLSHELRTPLTRLDIATDNLLTHREKGVEDTQIKLERIHKESQHIRKLVDDTLTLSWLDNESPQLRIESLDLVDLLEILIEDGRFEYPDKLISADLPNQAHIENSNHRALGQALENILRNALRYTPINKKVRISLIDYKHEYKIIIADQGPGVPKEHLNTIFRPFFRIDSARSCNSDSFGLGLALAQRQLHAIAATVCAKNDTAGGLVMTVTVPKGV